MKLTAEGLLQTEQFRGYVDSLDDPSAFLHTLHIEISRGKVDWLQEAFPEEFTDIQTVSSLLLNLQQDYDSIITDLPPGFHASKSVRAVHAGNTNQIGIYYDKEIIEGKGNTGARIACLSLHFLDVGNTQFMRIENVQGELKEGGRFSRKNVRKVFGKLNTYFGEDWRVGLVRQPVQHARNQGMEVWGQVPGLFYLFESNLPEYQLYSLNYVRTYLRSGIPLENIEFTPVPIEVQPRWATAVDFLRTKNPDERLRLLDQACREYTDSFRRLRREWLEPDLTKLVSSL